MTRIPFLFKAFASFNIAISWGSFVAEYDMYTIGRSKTQCRNICNDNSVLTLSFPEKVISLYKKWMQNIQGH